MGKIKVMSEALSNRIAAGEVIERPASVVKELIENSIDAGATKITVDVERAGSRLISVGDDGCGMDASDVMLALEPHGTSKLTDESQIDHIVTMGFRGEALPSIASISRLELYSRTADSPEGTVLKAEGGSVSSCDPAGGKVGTVVKIRDLFFNTPARKKFLKSPATEEHHIEEMVLSLALGHCGVGFLLRVDGRPSINVPPESVEDRLRELFGREFMRHMLKLEHREEDISIEGFVAEPGFTRPGRREQRCYINSRAVEAQAVYRGIRNGYGTIGFEAGRYPPAVLFITMPPEALDVNVHPAKREVRFKSEFVISRIVETAVRMALRRHLESGDEAAKALEVVMEPLTSTPKAPVDYVLEEADVKYAVCQAEPLDLPLDGDLSHPKPSESDDEAVELPPLPDADNIRGEVRFVEPVPFHPGRPPAEVAEEPILADRIPQIGEKTVAEGRGAAPSAAVENTPADENWPTEILGIYDQSYILCSGGAGLIIVDQHAAHERVMFEAIVADYENGEAVSQSLLLPAVLELPPPQLSLLLRHRKVFERLGFEFEAVGGRSVMFSAVPVRLGSKRPPEELVPDMLEQLLENAEAKLPVEGEYAARAACHAAVRAHDELTLEEAKELLDMLRRCKQGRLCPHGRPTMITITVRELEKRFLRR